MLTHSQKRRMQNLLYLFDHVICIEGSEQILTLFYFIFYFLQMSP